ERLEMRKDVAQVGAEQRLELYPQTGAHREGRVSILEPQPAPKRLDNRQQRKLLPVRDAGPLEPDHIAPDDRPQLSEETTLAEAGVSQQEQDPAAAGEEVVTRLLQPLEFGGAADERSGRRL